MNANRFKFASMTFEQCESDLKKQLQHLYDAGEAAAIADRVLEEYTGSNRLQRRMLLQQAVSQKVLLQLQTATAALLQGKPLQYVLGYADFYDLRFRVDETVLIPRPETEELVDWIIKDNRTQNQPVRVLDIGTGSGCIPIALKKHLPLTKITAIDVSEKALATAQQNAAANQAIIQFLLLDFLAETTWQQLNGYDVIVSNPPYIPQQEKVAMDEHVTAWEPATALFVPNEQPLLFYEKIAAFATGHLPTTGAIYLETHSAYAMAVQQLFTHHGYATELKKDLHGNDRMIKIVNSEA